jgi:hypothetical protein
MSDRPIPPRSRRPRFNLAAALAAFVTTPLNTYGAPPLYFRAPSPAQMDAAALRVNRFFRARPWRDWNGCRKSPRKRRYVEGRRVR